MPSTPTPSDGTRRPFEVFRGSRHRQVGDVVGPSVVAFGKFDGVHLGHQALLRRARQAADELGLPLGAATFERHPAAFFRPHAVPHTLSTLSERLRLLRQTGAEFVLLFPVDATVMRCPAKKFAVETLAGQLQVRLVVAGDNFRFGHQRGGSIVTLQELAVAGHPIDGLAVPTLEVEGAPVSATRIRAVLEDGDVQQVSRLLGRPFDLPCAYRPLTPHTGVLLVRGHRAAPPPGRYEALVTFGRSTPVPITITVASPMPGLRILGVHDTRRLPTLPTRARAEFLRAQTD